MIGLAREQTGDAALDRIQDNIKRVADALSPDVDSLKARATVLERARLGVAAVTLPDANSTLPTAQQGYGVLRLGGTLTAGRSLTFAGATNEAAYVVWVINGTAQTVTMGSSSGAGATVAAGTGVTRALLISAAGVERLL